MEKALARHKRVFRFCLKLLNGTLKSIYGFHPEPANVGKGPYLIAANHNGELDPALLALSFWEHMYFVSSEHVFRKGFLSWLLVYFFAPISRVKGTTDAIAALNIIRTVKKRHKCLPLCGRESLLQRRDRPDFPRNGKARQGDGCAARYVSFRGRISHDAALEPLDKKRLHAWLRGKCLFAGAAQADDTRRGQ